MKHRGVIRKRAVVFAPAAILAAVFAWAGVKPVEISTSAGPLEATVGDPIQLALKVVRDPDTTVTFPGEKVTLSPFELQGYTLDEPVTLQDGKIEQAAVYKLSAFETGELTIPAVEVAYKGPSGDGTASSEPMKILVRSVLGPGAAPEIKGIKPPVQIPLNVRSLVMAGAAALLVLGTLIYLVLRFAGRKRKPLPPEKAAAAEPLMPPREWALLELHKLAASPLLKQGKFKEYYIRASEIIKVFLGRRFEFDAVDRTSAEVMDDLREKAAPREYRFKVDSFLDRADMVKFAKLVPDAEDHRLIMKDALALVESAGPAGPAGPAEAGPAPPAAAHAAAAGPATGAGGWRP